MEINQASQQKTQAYIQEQKWRQQEQKRKVSMRRIEAHVETLVCKICGIIYREHLTHPAIIR